MPFMPNGYYNDGSMGQAFGNIASLFAAPTPQQMLTSQTIKQQNDAAAATADALSRQPATVRDLWNITHDPSKMAQFEQNVVAANGGSFAAQDPWAYAGTQDFGKTAASNLMKVVPKGSTFVAPNAVGGPYGYQPLAPAADSSGDSAATPATAGAPAKTAPVAAPVAAPGGPVGFAVPDDPATKQLSIDQLGAQLEQTAQANPNDPVAQANFQNHLKSFPRTAASTNINVNGNPNGIEDGYNKAIGAQLGNVVNAGEETGATRALYDQLLAASAAGGDKITTGPMAQYALKAKQFVGHALGTTLDGVPEAELMNNIGTTIASKATRAMSQRGGTQFEFANQLLTKPGLSQSRPGMEAIIKVAKQGLDDTDNLNTLAADPHNRAVWPQIVKNYYATHPVQSPFFPGQPLGPADMERINALQPPGAAAPGGGTGATLTPFNANGAGGGFNSTIPGSAAPFSGAAAASPATPRSQAEYDSLPAGTVYLAPDGQPRKKQ